MKIVILFFLFIYHMNIFAAFEESGVEFSKVAVMVYGQNSLAKKYSRAASTRVENILMDNGVEVLDQSEAEELKDVWKRLEDPGFFITAESFVENAEKYAVDGVIRVYLHAELTKGWGKSYSATAIADIRFVDNEANTLAYSSIPMGVPGKPPSDGLTKSSAVVNAIQRAVDEGGEKLGLEVIDVANPRTLKFT